MSIATKGEGPLSKKTKKLPVLDQRLINIYFLWHGVLNMLGKLPEYS